MIKYVCLVDVQGVLHQASPCPAGVDYASLGVLLESYVKDATRSGYRVEFRHDPLGK